MSAEPSMEYGPNVDWGDGGVDKGVHWPPRILVVDDDNGPRQALRMLLKESHDIRLASSVDEALSVIEHEPVDLVITDIRMPERSGIDLLRIIREMYPSTQVIILTGYAELDTAVKAIEYGAFAYLEKPFDSETLLDRVRAGLEKQRAEQERRAQDFLAIEANRFETLGRLISGMMHDLGTPLTVIGSNIEMIMSDPNREDMPDRLKTIDSQARHCNEMVRATMNFLRCDSQTRSPFCVNNVVQTCLEVAQPMLGRERIDVTTEFCEEMESCIGEVVLVRQALLNLITNACHAVHDQSPPRKIVIQTWIEEGCACVSVEDTGPGVPVELRERIFDTFFTTKGKMGTGLGLAVVKNVMERHDSSVTLADDSERGARFVLSFHVASREELLRYLRQTQA